jgi:hypothetical protein
MAYAQAELDLLDEADVAPRTKVAVAGKRSGERRKSTAPFRRSPSITGLRVPDNAVATLYAGIDKHFPQNIRNLSGHGDLPFLHPSVQDFGEA